MSIPHPNDWEQPRNCFGKPIELFFPEERGSTPVDALILCDTCACRVACAEYALQEEITFGVWGGLSIAERERIALVRSKRLRLNLEPVSLGCSRGKPSNRTTYKDHISIGEVPCENCLIEYRRSQSAYRKKVDEALKK